MFLVDLAPVKLLCQRHGITMSAVLGLKTFDLFDTDLHKSSKLFVVHH